MRLQQYKMTEKPKGKLKDKINIAVDSIIQMTLGAPACYTPVSRQLSAGQAADLRIAKLQLALMPALGLGADVALAQTW